LQWSDRFLHGGLGKDTAMFRELSLLMAAATLTPAAIAAPSTHPPTIRVFVELIVKACPAAEITGMEHRPEAVLGYYADPINQGVVYDNERSPTKSEREAYFATQHCIDVPIPPEVTTGGVDPLEMTMAQCQSHRGYLTAMQYLEQNPAYRTSFPAVGMWSCIEHPYQVQGVATM
jgi:hypothetical protein